MTPEPQEIIIDKKSPLDFISTFDYKRNRLSKSEAHKKLREILRSTPSNPIFSAHAITELEKDGLNTVDAINVLESPDARIQLDGEFENGSFRYRIETSFIMIVFAFNEQTTAIIVVTAWDKRKKG